MTLWYYALEYDTYPKAELRGFVLQRLRLSGREYSRYTKPALIRRLQELDDTDKFRFMDLPLELREHIYDYALNQKRSLPPLLRVCRKVHQEVKALHWKEVLFFICVSASYEGWAPHSPFSLQAIYDTRSQDLGRWHVPIVDYLYLRSDMFRNIRRLGICVDLRSYPRYKPAPNHVAANRSLFFVALFYACYISQCQLEVLRVWPHFQNSTDMDNIGVTEMVNIIWPLKLLEERTNVDVSAFPSKVIEAFSQEAIGVNETMTDACKAMSALFFGGKGCGIMGWPKTCAYCVEKENVASNTQWWLRHSISYIGPDSGPALAAFVEGMEEKHDLRHSACTCYRPFEGSQSAFPQPSCVD